MLLQCLAAAGAQGASRNGNHPDDETEN